MLYDTKDASREKTVTTDAAQGFTLGRDLWNELYDGILRTKIPEGTFLVEYADDITGIIEARYLERAQMKLNQVIRRVFGWMEEYDLDLAVHETEILIMTMKRIDTVITMQVRIETIDTKRAVKYLCVKLDTELTFWEKIKDASDKAATVMTVLSRCSESSLLLQNSISTSRVSHHRNYTNRPAVNGEKRDF